MSLSVKVAVYDDFLESYARLPRPQQRKVSEFLRKFRENPTSSAINYEKISDFRDPNLRTVRIDQAWRAIVLKPDRGDVFVLLWVDHHDEAMAWARNRRVEVHPDTGALQVFTGVTIAEVVEPRAGAVAAAPLFGEFRDRELVRIGVPEAALPGVRAVSSREELDALRPALPADAFESLTWLADGEPYAEVERIVAEASAPTPVPEADFAAALQTSASQRSFVLVEDDASLAAMLDAPLAKWRVFLHPSQRKLVEARASGPVRVLGGAGTGKTVVAMHRAVWLARNAFGGESDRVLFTTFTRNLALDIGQNLDALADRNARSRIDVTPIDVLVADLLSRAGYGRRIAYWGASDGRLAGLWKQALTERPTTFDQPDSFYRDEWELVVLPQSCRSWEAYRDATRSGRGVRLSRAQRQQIWPVFARYRALLDRAGLTEPEDAFLDAAGIIADQRSLGMWRAAVIDESQDMSTAAFRFLRALIPEGENDLFLVGDGHQRIYRRRVVLAQAGVLVRGRSHRLRINYRTTEQIRRFAAGLLTGGEVDDLDGEADTLKGYRSLTTGQWPEARAFDDFEAEADAVAAWVREDDIQRTCLVSRTKELRDRYAGALRARGVETCELNEKTAEKADAPGLRVATMHRVKGLEFDRVVLAGAGEGQVPFQRELERSIDEAVKEDALAQERALAYVALTRARKAALVTATGPLSALFKGPRA